MPVSDTTTVLSKLFTALVVAPAIVVRRDDRHAARHAAARARVILLIGGASPAPIWSNLQLFQLTIALLYALIAVALWYAPVGAGCCWSRRGRERVAVPVGGAAAGRSRACSSASRSARSYFAGHARRIACADGLQDGLRAALARQPRSSIGDGGVNATGSCRGALFDALDPVGFLSNPWLWVGLVVAAGLDRGGDLDAPLPRADLSSTARADTRGTFADRVSGYSQRHVAFAR